MFKLSKEKNRLIKHVLILTVVLLGSTISLALLFGQSSYVTSEGYFKEQPLAFSHKTHVDDVGIDCQYCHSQVSKGPHADIPSMETCYGCHQDVLKTSKFLSPVRDNYLGKKVIKWNRVNLLADHVHFNHAKHINQGISCTQCHGNVHNMPLMAQEKHFSMKMCLDCHRTFHDGRNAESVNHAELQGCYTCHR